jgi:molybdopterin synthase sulfur carrier subunit
MSDVVVEALTVDEAIMKLDSQFPGLREFILDDDLSLRKFVNIYVNDEDVRSGVGLLTALRNEDHMQIIPAVAGG